MADPIHLLAVSTLVVLRAQSLGHTTPAARVSPISLIARSLIPAGPSSLPCVSLFGWGPFLCPDLNFRLAPGAAAVKDGRRPPPARSVLDGGEHLPTLGQVGLDCAASCPGLRHS